MSIKNGNNVKVLEGISETIYKNNKLSVISNLALFFCYSY